jgi:hypothetical protein
MFGNGTERVRRARNYRLAHHVRTVGDQLESQRTARAMTEHIDRPAKVVAEGLSMPLGDLGEADICGHPWPAVGEIHFKAGTGQRVHGS